MHLVGDEPLEEDIEDNYGSKYLQWYDSITEYYRRTREMSLVLGLSGIDGIVVASDRREMVQAGGIDYHRDNVQKVYELTKNTGIMSIGNFVGFANWLLYYFIHKLLPKLKINGGDVSELSKAFSQFLKSQYQIYSEGVNSNWLVLSENLIEFVMAGYTKEGNGQLIRFTNAGRRVPFTPELLDEPYYFTGKNETAYYLMLKQRQEQPIEAMNINQLKRFAVYVITETSRVDDQVSLSIDMMVIRNGKEIEYINQEEIRQLTNEG